MLALAYDAALRREELCLLGTEDIDPGRRTLRVKAENTKNRMERVVPYSAATGVLLSVLSRSPGEDQPGARAAVPVGVAPQLRAAGDVVDLVEGRAADRALIPGWSGSPRIPPGTCA